MRTALPALALSLGLAWLVTSLPGSAAAQAPDQPVGAEPTAETAIATAPAAETAVDTEAAADAEPPAQSAVDAEPVAEAAAVGAEPAAAAVVDPLPAAKTVIRNEPSLETVAQVTDWVIASSDNGSLPFVIIDKVAAKVFVFGPDGQFKGAAPALLGSARGDNSTPGVGDRELSNIPPKQRTTPAGRFIAGFGPAYGGKSVLWVDYKTAISLHAVIVANPKEHRLQRLRSPTPKDNRITFGCINVPTAFYKNVVLPTFKGVNGIVYILPERTPLGKVLPAFQAHTAAAATQPDHAAGAAAAREALAPQ